MRRLSLLAVGVVVWAAALPLALHAGDVKSHPELQQKATWKAPSLETVREQALGWLAARELDDATRAQIAGLWASAATDEGQRHMLEVLCTTFAAADPRARELVATCSRARQQIALPNVEWLADEKTTALERDNLRLLYARWLIQELLFDEAGEQIVGLKPDEVVDPAALLFYQAVIHHHGLSREPGLQAVTKLLENGSEIPKRYVSVARLMQADLEVLKDESLDHIARRMDDIRRRLDLGRAGPKVRSVEDGVIASLDKLIEQIEKQQQAAAAAAASRSARGTLRPTRPAPDSTPMQTKGPGEIAKKAIGDSSGWGDLPPRQRSEILQQIGKDFPAHYRDMIEQYFRKLASESSEKPDK